MHVCVCVVVGGVVISGVVVVGVGFGVGVVMWCCGVRV